MINFFCRLMVATFLALGFGTLWFLLMIMIGGEILEAWQGPAAWPSREEFVVHADGTPLIRSTPRGSLVSAYRDLNGGELAEADNPPLVQPAWLDVGGRASRLALFDLMLDRSLSVANWSRRLRLFVDNSHPELYWFFVHNGRTQGAGYFVAYDRTQKRPVGCIGPAGFSATRCRAKTGSV
jgi:hypothetical protein